VNLDELKALFDLLEERDIAEFEIEEENLKLRIRRVGGALVDVATPASAGLAAPSLAGIAPATALAGTPAAPPFAPAQEDGLHVVKSPIVGTFYRAPDPSSAPFVNVGDRVRVGQVLCIIEAMKLMNEIEAEVAGEIVKVHHDSGQPVQYGEPLFSLRPDR
jgi:acetyl-CoA carboxylase biotin carboxyl carrier protein